MREREREIKKQRFAGLCVKKMKKIKKYILYKINIIIFINLIITSLLGSALIMLYVERVLY